MLPKEYECELVFRSVLQRSIDQRDRTLGLSNPAERTRKNIWWIDPDGANVDAVVLDVASSLLSQGVPWFERLTDLKIAFNDLENERDCYAKFRAAKYFAEQLALADKLAKYSALLMTEEKTLRAKGHLE
jgi:hypothetical protein